MPKCPRKASRHILPLAVLLAGSAGATVVAGVANAAATTDTLTFTASDDAYSSSSRPATNLGTADKLVAGRYKGDTMVTYLKFTVGALPGGTAVTGAQVTLTSDGSRLPSMVRLNKVGDNDWTERSLTAKNDPAVGAVVASVKATAKTKAVTFDVGSVVDGAGTYTFAVTSTDSSRPARFRSDEATKDKPALKVTVVKTPGTNPTPANPTPTPSGPSGPGNPGTCTVDAKLVPTCGVLWGAAAGGFSGLPRDAELKTWEQKSGRTATIFHTYHRGDEMFPNKSEIAMTEDPKNPRVMMMNWKVAYGSSWAKVAAGQQDARIDKLSAYLKANYTKKFFLVLHHEPENDVNPAAGSGMTAKDFAAMFRHTVLRMRADGVTNAIFTVAYMNYEKWNNSSWWYDMYPGDDVVDWLGVDTYNNAQPNAYHSGDFKYMMNRTTDKAKFPGFYTWATTRHAGKPIVAAEWGVYDNATGNTSSRGKVFDTVVRQLAEMPAIKGLVYFDTAKDQSGHDIRIDATAESLAAFRKVAASPVFDVKVP